SLFSRKYTVVKAVDGVSFTVGDGEAVGYIGANGAGKSTTIKMMSGILTPTSGEILIDGKHPYKSKERNAVLKTIGVVFGQKTQLWYDLPLTETYDLLKYIYDVPNDEYNRRMGELIELLDMKPFMDAPVRTLSLGQRMRADLAAAMLHNPKTLFLDEPTIGLDVLVKRNLVDAINKLKTQYHTTLILTTHAMSDIELLCERVIILDAGKVLFDGSLNDVKHMFGDTRDIKVTASAPIDGESVSQAFGDAVIKHTDEDGGHSVTFTIDGSRLSTGELLNHMFNHYEIGDVKISETGIEQVVEKIYEKNKNETTDGESDAQGTD
ncbi:MAG: ATP-binding cassette domain-containing protein, partial [Clostridiales bacterium]|nr:ATP-binding cassette domain-containing protein [Clostridiales bacterium]